MKKWFKLLIGGVILRITVGISPFIHAHITEFYIDEMGIQNGTNPLDSHDYSTSNQADPNNWSFDNNTIPTSYENDYWIWALNFYFSEKI